MKLLRFLGCLFAGLWTFLIDVPFSVGARSASGEVDQPQENNRINAVLDAVGLVLWVCLCLCVAALGVWWIAGPG